MSLLITMLPIYLLGNLHCIGMCGPLVMLIGRHRYRSLYFFGRLTSFSLAGALWGGVGGVLHLVLVHYQIPAVTSLLFGAVIIVIGVASLRGGGYPGQRWIAQRLSRSTERLSLLIGRDQPLATFLFGFFTVLLPCGQTLLVFSACALAADPAIGLLNGFAFALLTSPSLWLAMYAHGFLTRAKKHYRTALGLLALLVGALAVGRGLAELHVIPHLVLNAHASHAWRIVIY